MNCHWETHKAAKVRPTNKRTTDTLLRNRIWGLQVGGKSSASLVQGAGQPPGMRHQRGLQGKSRRKIPRSWTISFGRSIAPGTQLKLHPPSLMLKAEGRWNVLLDLSPNARSYTQTDSNSHVRKLLLPLVSPPTHLMMRGMGLSRPLNSINQIKAQAMRSRRASLTGSPRRLISAHPLSPPISPRRTIVHARTRLEMNVILREPLAERRLARLSPPVLASSATPRILTKEDCPQFFAPTGFSTSGSLLGVFRWASSLGESRFNFDLSPGFDDYPFSRLVPAARVAGPTVFQGTLALPPWTPGRTPGGGWRPLSFSSLIGFFSPPLVAKPVGVYCSLLRQGFLSPPFGGLYFGFFLSKVYLGEVFLVDNPLLPMKLPTSMKDTFRCSIHKSFDLKF